MINSRKKGFTLVELVIVIAVIAILAAVLIPTFSSLVKKANLSADQQAVRQINTLLATEFATEKPETLKEVVDMLDANGYDVDALEPLTEGYKFAWDKENNQIVFLTEAEATAYETLDKGVTYINEEVKNFDDFKAAIEQGKDITLLSSITDAEEIIIPAGANVTLNLGGNTYTTATANSGVSATSKYIKVKPGATLTIENGTFSGRGIMNEGNLIIKEGTTINAIDINGGGCLRNKPGAEIIIEGGTFNIPNCIAWDEVNKGGAAGIYNDGGTVLVKNGTFTSNTTAYLVSSVNGGNITIENGTFVAYRGALYAGVDNESYEGPNSTIIVNNGSFSVTVGPESGWVAFGDTYGTITLNGGSYTTVTSNKFNGNVIEK